MFQNDGCNTITAYSFKGSEGDESSEGFFDRDRQSTTAISGNGKSDGFGNWVHELNTRWKYRLNRLAFSRAVDTSWEPKEDQVADYLHMKDF